MSIYFMLYAVFFVRYAICYATIRTAILSCTMLGCTMTRVPMLNTNTQQHSNLAAEAISPDSEIMIIDAKIVALQAPPHPTTTRPVSFYDI